MPEEQSLYRIVIRQVLSHVQYVYAQDEEEAEKKRDFLDETTSISEFECVDAERWVEKVENPRDIREDMIEDFQLPPTPRVHTRSTPGA